MKVLLTKSWPDSFDWYHSHMLGLAYLAGYIRRLGHEVEILDGSFLRMNEKTFLSALDQKHADVIGITAMTHEIPRARTIAQFIKAASPHTPVVLGGPHATVRPAETLAEIPEIDFAVAGEGERPLESLLQQMQSKEKEYQSIPGLAYRMQSEIAFTGPQRDFLDLKSAPGPAVDLYYSEGWFKDHPKSEYRILASRGCPFRCSYCLRVLGNRVRWRDPAAVIEEWEKAVRYYQARVVFFHDEIFLYNNPHTHAILDGIIRTGIHERAVFNGMTHVSLISDEILRKAKKAGCYKICIGIESGNDEILKSVRRNYTVEEANDAVGQIKRHKIRPFAFFILGHPGETHKTLRDTIRAAVRINPFEIGMGIMVPYPGTEIYELAKSNQGGYKLLAADWDAYDRYGGKALGFDNFTYRQLLMYQIVGYFLFFVLNGKFSGMFNYFLPKLKAVKRLLLNQKL